MGFFEKFGNVKPVDMSGRSFEAADVGELYGSWKPSDGSYNSDVFQAMALVRRRARDLENNNDYVKGFLRGLHENVIGPRGFKLVCKFKDAKGELCTSINDELEHEYKKYCRKGSFDVTGRYSATGYMQALLQNVARDGEALSRIVYNTGHNRFGICNQMIPIEFLDENLNTTLLNGNTVKMGIEFDSWGKPVAYLLKAGDAKEYFVLVHGKKYFREDARNMFHIFRNPRPEAVRDVSWFASSMLRQKMLAGMEEATLVATRIAASKMAFLMQREGSGIKEGLYDAAPERRKFEFDAAPGKIPVMPAWVSDVKYFDPDQPKDTYAPFVKNQLRGFATGVGGAYSALASDYESVSYSALRKETMREQNHFTVLQEWFVDEFARPSYQKWLRAACLKRAFRTVKDPDEYMEADFVGHTWGMLDPYKEVSAMEKSVKNRFKSRTHIAAQHGADYMTEVWPEIEAEAKAYIDLAKKHNISFEGETPQSIIEKELLGDKK